MKEALEFYHRHRDKFEEAIRQRVCTVCEDFGEDNHCHTRDEHGCAVKRFMGELVLIALQIYSKDIGPYQQAVREKICSICPNPDPEGHCLVRERMDCALDRYLPLVLDAVDDVCKKVGWTGP